MRTTSTITILFFLLIMFQNCGMGVNDMRPIQQPVQRTTDEEFVPFIQEFEGYASVDTSQIPITFADLNDGIAGICYYFRLGQNAVPLWGHIEIDRAYWAQITQNQKINLIFHELGHCYMGRDHTDSSTFSDGCPKSFMHDHVLGNYCLNLHYADYINEMF